MNHTEKAAVAVCLVLSLALFAYASIGVRAYTGTANVTSATLSDMRVNPSQSVIWTLGPVWNSTDQPVGGGNSSLSFDGVGDELQVTSVPELKWTGGSFSFEFWFNQDAADAGTSYMVSKAWNGAGEYNYRVWTDTDHLHISLAGTTAYSSAGIGAFTDDSWNHVAVILTATTVNVYLNGANILSANHGIVAWVPAGGDLDRALTMANIYPGEPDNVNFKFVGELDEPRVYYNRALTPTEVAQHAQGIYISETGLELHLDMDGQVTDQSGNGNDGTILGNPAYVDGWASVPVSTYFNGSISVNSRRILVNSTDAVVLSTIPDTAPTPVGTYNGTVAPDNSIGNGTITGFIVDRYEVYLEAQYEETEAGFSTLLTAQGSSAVDGHALGSGDSFTIDGIAFTWNTYTSNFTATDSKATPQTVTYGTVITGSEATYGITNFSANNTATVTWITGTLDRLQSWFITGDWIGAAFSELFLVTGQVAGVTLILGIFSLAAYQYSGPYATFGIWLFGWAVFISQVHGVAQQMAILLFAVGVGLALAKLINDRRNA